ncbi:hypothetical protein KY284_017539 [Solanum tuberosum]|nr:hypothetical protein KY284_017539 [Solanum tuberosum]
MPQRQTIRRTILGSIDQPPQSWLEMGLSGHSMDFTFEMGNNQDITLDIQDPMFMAQIITEGMRFGQEAFDNRMNFPAGTELPFYHPEQHEVTVLVTNNPIQVPISVPSNNTHDAPPLQQSQIEVDTIPLPSMKLQQGIRPKMYLLNSMKSFIVEEEYILMCPVRLSKCTMDIRVITNPNSKKFAVFLVPTLLPIQTNEDDEESPKMSLMIWNCRGSEQSDFRTSYRSMLNYHHPTMVLLLETHMTHHQHLADDFSFTDIANVPAIGGCGGMALVWKKDSVVIDGLAMNDEGIHCTIQIP